MRCKKNTNWQVIAGEECEIYDREKQRGDPARKVRVGRGASEQKDAETC